MTVTTMTAPTRATIRATTVTTGDVRAPDAETPTAAGPAVKAGLTTRSAIRSTEQCSAATTAKWSAEASPG
jgi:hypothetical protein